MRTRGWIVFLMIGAMWGAVLRGSDTSAPETQPATQKADVPKVIAWFNALPKNLWPRENETAAHVTLREKWLRENSNVLRASDTFTGTLVEATIPQGSQSPHLTLSCGTYSVWGSDRSLIVTVDAKNVSVETAGMWDKGRIVTVSGVPAYSISGGTLSADIVNGHYVEKK